MLLPVGQFCHNHPPDPPTTGRYFCLRQFGELPETNSSRRLPEGVFIVHTLKPLLHFEGGLTNELQAGILFSFRDYLELVDWTGRIIRKDKQSYIDNELPPVLHRLQISPRQWHLNTTQFEEVHPRRFNRVEPTLDTG